MRKESSEIIMITFSIVMTCYNLEKYVAEALQSVFAQNYPGQMELIVVDDCSTDRSMERIREAVAAYGTGWEVKVVQPEKNLGVAGATDYGWQHAKNDWIIMVDGDDIQYSDRCSKTAELIARHPDATMLICSADHADTEGNVYGYQGFCWKAYEESPEEVYLASTEDRMDNYLRPDGYPKWRIFGCCMAVSRKLYLQWGDLMREGETERCAQDPTWALRAFVSGPVLGSRVTVCKYRAHEGNILNKSFEWEKLSSWFFREQHMSGFYRLNSRNIHQMLRDIGRVQREAGISDCSAEQLERLHTFIKEQETTFEILGQWWNLPWFKRLALAVSNPLPENYRKWPWPRLLPFRLYVFARWLIKQKLRRKG